MLFISYFYFSLQALNKYMERKKFILITGASTGIGYDASRYFLNSGYHVISTVRKESDKQKLLKELPGNLKVLILDVARQDQIEDFSIAVKEIVGDNGLFALVNNAGVAMGGPLLLLSDEEFEMQMQTNLNSVFRVSNAMLPLMGASFDNPFPPGRIVNISSVSGLVNTPMLGPYCISKHALESMSDIYRRELSVYGIKVILLEPGPIKTPIWNKSVPDENPFVGTDFENVYSGFKKSVKKSEENALPVEVVSEYIHKAITNKNPKNRYIISKRSFIIRIFAHAFPSKWLDRIFEKQVRKGIGVK